MDQAFAVGVQEAVVPSVAKAFGQDIAQEVPEERGARQGPDARLSGFAVLVPEGHFAVLAGEDVLLLEHAAIEIAAEVEERLVNGADGGAVDDPLLRHLRGHGPLRLGQCLQELGAKDLRERFLAEQVGSSSGTGFGAPPAVLGIDRRRRDGQVDMRVVVQAPGVGMQHRDRPGGALQPPIVAGEGVEGFPTALQ